MPTIVDPVDLLVPPPRSLGRAAIIGTLTLGVLALVGLLASIGAVNPKVAVNGMGGDHWTTAATGRTPSMAFFVTNNSPYTVKVVQVDGAEAGLSTPTLTVTLQSPDRLGGEPKAELPLSLAPHASLEIGLVFHRYDCQSIATGGAGAVTIDVRDLFGVTRPVPVTPMRFRSLEAFDPGPTHVSNSSVSWPAALTWTACGRSGPVPTPQD